MNSNIFQKAFVHVLHEAPQPPEAQDPNAMSDSAAMQQTLDSGTEASDFNVDAGVAADHVQASAKMHASMVSALQAWINQLEQFSRSLNGTDDQSMQSKLKNSLPNTLFDKIRVAETKKIARVSMEVTSLNEMLKGYLASQDNPALRGV